MKTIVSSLCALAFGALLTASSRGEAGAAPKETSVGGKPLGIAFSVKMTGPYAQDADLQIICAFKHKASGDTYQGAMKDSDAKVGGLISSLRNRGEFVGELGESTIEVGEGDSAFVASVLAAYDTEQRLQAQGLAEKFTISEWVIEAGPSF